ILHAEEGLGIGRTLISSLSKPFCCLSAVLRNAGAFGVHVRDSVLGFLEPLIGCLSIPLRSFGYVPRNAVAGCTHKAELELGGGVALIGCLAIPFRRLASIFRHTTIACSVHFTKFELAISVTPFGHHSNLAGSELMYIACLHISIAQESGQH